MAGKGRRLGLAVLAAALAAPAAQAANGHDCKPRAQMISKLTTGFGESAQAVGLVDDNAMVELYASEATGTWTITVTLPDGMTCMLASGAAYEAFETADAAEEGA